MKRTYHTVYNGHGLICDDKRIIETNHRTLEAAKKKCSAINRGNTDVCDNFVCVKIDGVLHDVNDCGEFWDEGWHAA